MGSGLRERVWATSAMDLARGARRRHAVVDKAATWVELGLLLARTDPILILAPGKTGTTSLAESIEAATDRPVLKSHSLTREGIAERREAERVLGLDGRPRFLWRTELMRHDLRLRRRRRWQVVCGVRDPVGRATSAYFYRLQLRADAGVGTTCPDDLDFHGREVEVLLARIGIGQDWFRDELKPVTGFDVYARPFPWEQGWATYDHDRFGILLLRSEDLQRAGGGALGAFFGLDVPLPVARKNVGSAGEHGSPYQRFLAEWRFEESLVQAVYDTPLACHFYSPTERQQLATRWIGGRSATAKDPV